MAGVLGAIVIEFKHFVPNCVFFVRSTSGRIENAGVRENGTVMTINWRSFNTFSNHKRINWIFNWGWCCAPNKLLLVLLLRIFRWTTSEMIRNIFRSHYVPLSVHSGARWPSVSVHYMTLAELFLLENIAFGSSLIVISVPFVVSPVRSSLWRDLNSAETIHGIFTANWLLITFLCSTQRP